MNEERLLRLREVSARLALSRTTIYSLMASGVLKPVKIGGALRFPASAIDRLVEGSLTDGAKEEAHAQAD